MSSKPQKRQPRKATKVKTRPARAKSVPPRRERRNKNTLKSNDMKSSVNPNRDMNAARKKAALGFSIVSDSKLTMGTSVMTIPTVMRQSELGYALMTYASNVYFRGTLGASANTPGTTYADFNAGLAYLGESIQHISEGGLQEVTVLPQIFDVLTTLLQTKKLKLNRGTIQYTPAWDSPFGLNLSTTTPTGSVFTFATPTSLATINVPVIAIAPTSEGYSALQRVSPDDKYGSKVVKLGEAAPYLSHDASCYARTYTYFGASGEVGSLYSESELEMEFGLPHFSKFVVYDLNDSVVSRVFHPTSGSIVTPIGLSLTTQYDAKQLRNIAPVQYKFIDFYQFYAMVGSWLVAVWDSTPAGVTGNNMFNMPEQFPFSINEFQWLLRQAILSVFTEQCHSQFVAPVKSSPNVNNSVFEPFIVDSITTSNPLYSTMMLPSFLVENLNMLKSRYFDDNKGLSVCRHHWIPVWGVYSGDESPIFSYTDPVSGLPIELFTPTNQFMPSAVIWDASGAVIGTKVQVNNFVPDFMSAWNAIVEGYAKRSSTPLSMISTDNKNIASLLSYTRVLNKIGVQEERKGAGGFKNPIANFIVNGTAPKPIDDSKKKKVKAIAPATYIELETTTITSVHELNAEVQGALRYFLIPSIRLNYTSGDLLTLNAYQTYTGEICQSTSINGVTNIAPNELYRLFSVGVNLSSGLFAADATNDVLTAAIKTMSDSGAGLDFLKALLGGISSVIPVVGPIISGLIGS